MDHRNGKEPARGRVQQAVDAWEQEILEKPPLRAAETKRREPEPPEKDAAGEEPRPGGAPSLELREEPPARPVPKKRRESRNTADTQEIDGTGAARPEEPAPGGSAPDASAPHAGDGEEETAAGQGGVLRRLCVRCALCMVPAAALLFLVLAPAAGFSLPAAVNPGTAGGKTGILAVSLLLLLAEGAVGYSVAFLGVGSLFTMRPDVDSIASLAFYASLLAVGFGLPAGRASYAGFAASAGACLALNFFGKLFHVARVRKALRVRETLEENGFLAAAVLKPEIAAEVYKPFDGIPAVAAQRKGKTVCADAQRLYAPTPADRAGHALALTALLGGLLAALADVLLLRRGFADAAGAFAAVCCIASPLLFEAGMSVPFFRAGGFLAKRGAFLAGYGEVVRFGGADAVAVEAKQLFPKGSVRMLGVKSYGKHDLAASVLTAASVSAEGQSPLAEAFFGIVADGVGSGAGGRVSPLPCRAVYEDECGLLAAVDGKEVLLGSRRLMRHHAVEVPAREQELRHTENGQSVLYFAVDGQLRDMFILDYEGGDAEAGLLRSLSRAGIRVLVCSTDPNVNPLMLEEQFGLPSGAGTMLGAREMRLLDREGLPVRGAGLAFSGLEGLISAVCACVRLRGTLCAQAAVQTALAMAGAAAAACAALFAAAPLSPLQVLGYQALCAVPALLLMLRR